MFLKYTIFVDSDISNIDDSGPTIEEMEDVQSSDDTTSNTKNIEDSTGEPCQIF